MPWSQYKPSNHQYGSFNNNNKHHMSNYYNNNSSYYQTHNPTKNANNYPPLNQNNYHSPIYQHNYYSRDDIHSDNIHRNENIHDPKFEINDHLNKDRHHHPIINNLHNNVKDDNNHDVGDFSKNSNENKVSNCNVTHQYYNKDQLKSNCDHKNIEKSNNCEETINGYRVEVYGEGDRFMLKHRAPKSRLVTVGNNKYYCIIGKNVKSENYIKPIYLKIGNVLIEPGSSELNPVYYNDAIKLNNYLENKSNCNKNIVVEHYHSNSTENNNHCTNNQNNHHGIHHGVHHGIHLQNNNKCGVINQNDKLHLKDTYKKCNTNNKKDCNKGNEHHMPINLPNNNCHDDI